MNPIRTAFDIYLRERWEGALEPVRRSSVLITPGAQLKNKYMSEIELACRVGVAQARAIIDSKSPDIIIPKSKQKPKRFTNRAEVNAIVPDGMKLMSLKEASGFIGVSPIFVKVFVDQNFLFPIDGPNISGNKRYLFAQPDLAAFVSSVTQYASQICETDTISFSSLLRAHFALGFSIETALSLISGGILRPSKTTECASSLANLRFSKSELSRVLVSMPPSEATVTRAWVMQNLGINKRTVQFLVKEGHLAELPGRCKQKPISKSSFEIFNSRWIKSGLLAEKFNTNRMLCIKAMTANSIDSIICASDPTVASFFDRGAALSLQNPDEALDQAARYRGKKYSEYMAIRREGRQH